MAVYGAPDADAGLIEGNEIPLRDTAGRDLDLAWQIAERHPTFEIGPTMLCPLDWCAGRPVGISPTGRNDRSVSVAAAKASIAARRAYAGRAILRQGFRPFFLAAGVWAAGAVALRLAEIAGLLAVPSAFDPIAWHAHELLFGFVAAAIAGFLLTAIPMAVRVEVESDVRGEDVTQLVGTWFRRLMVAKRGGVMSSTKPWNEI